MTDNTTQAEEVESYSSDIVAPVDVSKSPEQSCKSIGSHSGQSSSRALSICPQSQTPIPQPLTSARENYLTAQQFPPKPVVHSYLRALHDYIPTSIVSSSINESSVIVAMKQGAVVLIHSVHPTGWADGTVLATRARGWLPTNYCEPYNHPTICNLLSVVRHFCDLFGNGECEDLCAFTKQGYVKGTIAGVRLFLVRLHLPQDAHTNNCLHQEGENRVPVRRLASNQDTYWSPSPAERSLG